MAYLMCVTAESGIPLFSRTRGNLPQLPFPAIGSLNGVYMFAKNQDSTLLSTMTDDAKVVWKTYHDSVTLILVLPDDNACDVHATSLLDLIFSAMVLLVGIDELTTIKNVERLKRELKCCYSLIDNLLEGTDLCGDICQSVDVILCKDMSTLQEYLDGFVSAAKSEFGCLLVMGKVVVASERWWELTGIETVLLSLLVHTLPPCSSRDIPVYLPYGSPKVPHRLLTFQIIDGIEVCMICGPTPSLFEVEGRLLEGCWRTSLDLLKGCLKSHPRNLPPGSSLDPGILGFMLVNREDRKCLSSVYPSGAITGPDTIPLGLQALTRVQRKAALSTFYKSVVGTIFPSPVVPSEQDSQEPSGPDGSFDRSKEFSHDAMETYICSLEYKCYAMRTETHEIYMLYAKDVPTFAIRNLTHETLAMLTRDHLV